MQAIKGRAHGRPFGVFLSSLGFRVFLGFRVWGYCLRVLVSPVRPHGFCRVSGVRGWAGFRVEGAGVLASCRKSPRVAGSGCQFWPLCGPVNSTFYREWQTHRLERPPIIVWSGGFNYVGTVQLQRTWHSSNQNTITPGI